MCVHEIVVANKRPKWYIVDKQKALYTRTECDESRKIPKRSDYFFFRTKLNADDSLLWKDEAMFVYVCVSVDRKTNFVRFHWMYASGCVQYFLGKV